MASLYNLYFTIQELPIEELSLEIKFKTYSKKYQVLFTSVLYLINYNILSYVVLHSLQSQTSGYFLFGTAVTKDRAIQKKKNIYIPVASAELPVASSVHICAWTQ